MAVKVQFEIGHHSKLRSKKSPEGFTHDWELYVQGVNKADISTFVDKVVFNLHDTFPKPKRVLKEPPYAIQESGYAGFTLPIDIYFRNRDEPKRVRFDYDLDLQNSGPPQHRSEIKNFIFECPAEELRAKLLKGGGVPVAGVISGGISESSIISSSNMANDDGGGMVSKPKLSGVGDKKHKSRTDDAKMNTFATLFGTPITKTSKPSPDNRATTGSSSVNVNNTLPPSKEKSSKDKLSSSSSEKTKEKSDKKDKQKQNSPHKDKEKKSSYGDKQRSGESKKDKNRDKERESKRDKSNSSNREGIVQKLAASHAGELGSASPKKLNPASPKPPLNDAKVDSKLVAIPGTNSVKLNDVPADTKPKESSKSKEQSSSSGKKSKKDKKDKDKEREREKEREKEKQRSGESKVKETLKEPAGENKKPLPATAPQNSSSNSSSTSSTGNSSKRNEKDGKQHASKVPEKPAVAKESSNDATTAADNSQLRSDKTEKKSSSSKDPASTDKDKKSHKHKKKDKSKDRDKERERERERDKEKNKERERDKDKEKLDEKKIVPNDSNTQQTAITPAGVTNAMIKSDNDKADMPAKQLNVISTVESINASTPAAMLAANTLNNSNSISPTKKSQSKDKKSKERSSKDELKRQRDTAESSVIPKKKHKSSSNKNATQDLDLSEVDSVQSASDILAASNNVGSSIPSATQAVSATTTTIIEPSDSSSSSFPDLPPKERNLVQTKATDSAASSPVPNTVAATKEAEKAKATATQQLPATNGSIVDKETKQRPDKSIKGNDKHEKSDKPEKDSKKRKRNNAQQQQTAQAGSTSTFIEPPVKQAKKEQVKATREKSKSPALRATAAVATINANTASVPTAATSNNNSGTNDNAFLAPPATAAPVANITNNHLTSPINNNNNVSNNNNNLNITANNEQMSSTPASVTTAGNTTVTNSSNISPAAINSTATTPTANNAAITPTATGTWPTDYLNELQELHHKIMTLQDNDELQQVVEMIAETGCYEITTKTFDFDLCKLDRSTVQRLQEFLATSK